MHLRLRTKILLVFAIFLAVTFVLGRMFDLSKIVSFLIPKKVEVTTVKYFPFSTERSLEEWDEKISQKRKERDWDAQINLSIDPATAKRLRGESNPTLKDTCTMCGEYCAIKIVADWFKPARSNPDVTSEQDGDGK